MGSSIVCRVGGSANLQNQARGVKPRRVLEGRDIQPSEPDQARQEEERGASVTRRWQDDNY